MQNSIDRILELLRNRGDTGNGGNRGGNGDHWVNIIQNVDFFIKFFIIFYYFILTYNT